MADDILNEGSEGEEKSSEQNQSDDDFGLPDLEFDDLQELDMSFDDSDSDAEGSSEDSGSEIESGSVDFDMSLVEDAPEIENLSGGLKEGDLDPPTADSVLDEGIDEVEDVLDSAQLISDRLGDDQGESDAGGINYDDLIGSASLGDPDEKVLSEADDSTTADDTNDLFADVDSPDDLAAMGFADEDETPQADLGSSLFDSDDDNMEVAAESDSIFGSDSLVTEESEENLAFESSDDSSLPPNYKSYTYEESSGKFTKVIVIGIIVIAVAASGLLYFSSQGPSEKKPVARTEKPKPKPEKTAEEIEAEKAAAAKAAEERAKAAAEKPKPKPKPEALASAASPGEIIKIGERTTKSYVIVGSFIDEDLAMDYAIKLSNDGKGVKIIQPYGKSKRYRVSVADYPTYGDAASQLDSYKGEFGDQVWALKY